MGTFMEEDEKVVSAEKCWWVRTEIIIALANDYRLTRDEKYLDDALLTLDIIKKYIIDCKDGGFMIIQECACKSLKE